MATELAYNPDYLAYRFDFATENVEFLPITRGDIRRVSALKHTFIDPDRKLVHVPLAKLAPLLESPDPSLSERAPRFIFHTAFCTSTFLSRMLDVEGVSISLREPQILLDAANARRLQWQSRTTALNYRQFPKLALSLLQKHAATTEKLIIKPANSVNNIVPKLLQLTRPARSLMLYTDARNFLLSTLRKGEGGRQIVRSMFDLLRCDFPHLEKLRLTDTIHMTDLKIILTLWRLQIEQAKRILHECASDDLMASVYGERLVDDTAGVLHAANHFLDLGIPPDTLAAITASDERFRDAKDSEQRFSAEKRAATYQALEDFYGADLDHGMQWMLRNNPGTRLIPELSGALEA
jgi:hypothetical protein